jgi:hypothetical protein
MGKTLLGSTTRQEDVNLLTPEQQQLYSQALQSAGPGAIQSLQNQLQPQSMEDMQALFQQSYIDPALQALNQQILPAIQQRFTDANAGSSSALNQALSQSATDLSTNLGSQFGQFFQNQQGLQQNALNQFLPMLSQQTFSPVFNQQQGLAGPLIGAAGQIGAGYAMGGGFNPLSALKSTQQYGKLTR